MINIPAKAKTAKKPQRKSKGSGSVPRRPAGFFKGALTREDIAEINLFSRAVAKMNATAR